MYLSPTSKLGYLSFKTDAHLRVIYVHVSWTIVGNSISDIQMTLISNDQLRFGLLNMRLSVCTCFIYCICIPNTNLHAQ